MKLTDKLKTQAEFAAAKEEKKDAIKQTGMLLSDNKLNLISGGKKEYFVKGFCMEHGWYASYECPLCASKNQDYQSF